MFPNNSQCSQGIPNIPNSMGAPHGILGIFLGALGIIWEHPGIFLGVLGIHKNLMGIAGNSL